MAKPKAPRTDEIIRYYEIEQSKLLLDFEKVALFTDHSTSLGSFRERRLRQYIREFTPSQLSVDTGFVSMWKRDSGKIADARSRQIDCLVFDAHTVRPLLQTDDYAIISPEAFYAAIEVKSSLTFFREMSGTDIVSPEYPLQAPNENSYPSRSSASKGASSALHGRNVVGRGLALRIADRSSRLYRRDAKARRRS